MYPHSRKSSTDAFHDPFVSQCMAIQQQQKISWNLKVQVGRNQAISAGTMRAPDFAWQHMYVKYLVATWIDSARSIKFVYFINVKIFQAQLFVMDGGASLIWRKRSEQRNRLTIFRSETFAWNWCCDNALSAVVFFQRIERFLLPVKAVFLQTKTSHKCRLIALVGVIGCKLVSRRRHQVFKCSRVYCDKSPMKVRYWGKRKQFGKRAWTAR